MSSSTKPSNPRRSAPKLDRSPIAAAASQVADPGSESQLGRAADSLFSAATNPVILNDGSKVEVFPCKTRHVGLLLLLFNTILARMDRTQMVELVKLIAKAQEKKIGEGGKLSDLFIQDVVDAKGEPIPEDVQMAGLVNQVFTGGELLLTLFYAAYETLPAVVEQLSDMTKEAFLDTDPDDGMKIAGAIFAMNYGFFSRSLPRAFPGFVALLMQKARGQS